MLLLSPGPGICDEDVLTVLSKPCIHHRSDAFKKLYIDCINKIKKLLHAPNSEIIFMNGSGSFGMEGAIRNLINKEDTVLSIRCGYFSDRFYQMAAYQSSSMYSLQYPKFSTYHLQDVEYLLQHRDIDVVLVTHCETETGSLQDLKSLGDLCHRYHALLMVDSISGAIMNEVFMEDWHIDCLIMASQKGFLLPPGISITALSKNAVAKMALVNVNSYVFDYKTMLLKQHDDARIHSTPSINLFYGLHIALKKLTAVSSSLLANYYRTLHDDLRDSLTNLGFTIMSKGHESNSIIVCIVPKGNHAKAIQQQLEDRDIRIETGLIDPQDQILRIGIMNAVRKSDLDKLAHALEEILYG